MLLSIVVRLWGSSEHANTDWNTYNFGIKGISIELPGKLEIPNDKDIQIILNEGESGIARKGKLENGIFFAFAIKKEKNVAKSELLSLMTHVYEYYEKRVGAKIKVKALIDTKGRNECGSAANFVDKPGSIVAYLARWEGDHFVVFTGYSLKGTRNTAKQLSRIQKAMAATAIENRH